MYKALTEQTPTTFSTAQPHLIHRNFNEKCSLFHSLQIIFKSGLSHFFFDFLLGLFTKHIKVGSILLHLYRLLLDAEDLKPFSGGLHFTFA